MRFGPHAEPAPSAQPGVPTAEAGAALIHRLTKRNACLDWARGTRSERFLSTSTPLRRTHAGSVIEEGAAWLAEPYTWTVMPGVEVVSTSADSRWAVFRSTRSPSAI